MKNLKEILILTTVLSFITISNIQAQLSSQEVDQLVENAMQKFKVAGVAVAIVKDGKIIHKKGYGVKSIETNQKVNENTNFAIGSNSKAFTTTALTILVEEGKLSWTDKVVDYLPEFKMYNDYVTENFTVEDLLTHHSGLGLGVGDLMLFPAGSDFTIKDVLKCFQYFKPGSAFRTKFDYDNNLYLVAGELIARVSGMSWETFVQKHIMDALGMENSYCFYGGIKDKTNLATPHSSETGTIKTINSFGDMINGAAGGIISNVNDLCTWMLLHLNKGKYGEGLKKQLFSQESQGEMWKIHTVEETNPNPRYNSHFKGYGLGWELTDLKGNLSVSHTGGIPGMLSMIHLIPDLNLGIVILTNTENGGVGVFSAVNQTIVDSYLGLKDYGWVDKYYNYFQTQKTMGDSITKKVWVTVDGVKKTSIKNEDFVGIYADNWFGKIEVYVKDNQLWFKSYRSPKLKGQMRMYKANTFAIKWEYPVLDADAFAMFCLDSEGKAQSIKLKGISPNIDFSYDFQDLDLQRIEK